MKRYFTTLRTGLLIAAATIGLSACVYYPTGPAYGYYPSQGYYAPAPVYGSVVIGGGGGGYYGHHGWR